MSNRYKHVVTSDSITVIGPNGTTVIQRTAPNFQNLRAACLSNDDAEIEKHLDQDKSIESWARGLFKIEGDNIVTYKGEKVAPELATRMFEMARKGENPVGLMAFWEKLTKNPSYRSVESLYTFLKHSGIPILPNGNFLAYKGVKSNYTDQHSGVVDNKPGTVNQMARNKVSDDPRTECHYGFHVGDLSYARGFASIVIVCEVNPEHVVCVPYDESARKMRVCEYRVVGNHNGELLPNTSYELETDLGVAGKHVHEAEELQNPAPTLAELQVAKENKLQAIKMYRERTKLGLMECKEAIKEGLTELKRAFPMALASPPESAKPEPAGKKQHPSPPAVPPSLAPEPVEKRLKTQRAADKKVTLKVPRKYQKLFAMRKTSQLLEQDISTLRDYATHVLHIVGASKILGGKVNLVARIMEVRRNYADEPA